MSMTDPIADLLTRIRNAQQAKHPSLRVPASRLKESILKVLEAEGYIVGYQRLENKPQDVLRVDLKYVDGLGAIEGVRRESKPGRRRYVGVEEIPRVRNGLGVAVMSTSRGVMADHNARQARVGGEVLLSIW